jgi:hypothetical protein
VYISPMLHQGVLTKIAAADKSSLDYLVQLLFQEVILLVSDMNFTQYQHDLFAHFSEDELDLFVSVYG